MKALLLKTAFLLLPIMGFSQFGVPQTVYDPAAAANMGKQIATSAEQLNQFQKSLEYLKKAEDKLNQVNGYVRNMKDLNDIKNMYAESISMSQKIRVGIPRMKNVRAQKLMTSNVTNIVTSLNDSINFITKILSSNFFSMTDTERMDLIKKEKSKVFLRKSQLASYLN